MIMQKIDQYDDELKALKDQVHNMDTNYQLNDGAHEEIESLQQNYWVDELYQLTNGRFKSNSDHNSLSQ